MQTAGLDVQRNGAAFSVDTTTGAAGAASGLACLAFKRAQTAGLLVQRSAKCRLGAGA